ncbi:peptidylprolyl isomerase [Mangrovibacter plantisponsor]|uniref:Periplasmic chaperone PpiD n=1 Tax=Mangrovibacter plantisponsor TaxID=451513 RepID=A0A317Q118_9ENTR|nr:peptidylprolyl isomerase [Mangrovibacter plantisponsor]PWW08248.1 peptidyl-prolyl cis-trans isomerase D [Mangrovibacter plantisponsor]
MMDTLRAASSNVVLKIILGAIILSFVLTGVSSYLIGGSNDFAAKVNGQKIDRAQFENAVTAQRSNLQQQLGDQYSVLAANEGYMQEMRQQVLQRLIDEALIDQYAKHLGLSISDDQIKQNIFNTQAFQNNGKFDNNRFNTVLANARYTPERYAEILRHQLTTQQLIDAVEGTGFTLPGEENRLAALVSQKRIVREATIDVKALADKQTAPDDAVKAYYDQHQSLYRVPEQFRVSYIKLDAADMQANVTDADIQAYYDEHRAEFTQPQRDRYSVIQTKTEKDAQDVLDALKKGADFATLAKEKSTDIISARTGGDMGWLEPSTTPDELKNAGLTQKGQLSGVIKSSVGFLVARLDDVQPAVVKPLADVRDSITAKVKGEKALDAYYALQQKVSDAASNDNQSLEAAEQVAGVKAVETGWFTQDSVPAELNFKPVTDAIFNGGLLGQDGSPGSNSDIITVDGDRAFVVRIAQHKAESTKPLAEVQDQVVAAVKMQKASEQARIQASKLLTELKAGKGDDAMKAAGLAFGEKQTLTRSGQDPVTRAAFELPLPAKDQPVYGTSNDLQGNVLIIALDAAEAGDMPEAQKTAMASQVASNNAQIALESLLNTLRKEAKIKVSDVVQQQQ